MNSILITSAGRRVELVQAFKDQLAKLDIAGSVHAGDANPKLAAACHVADTAVKLPSVSDPTYTDYIAQYCSDHKIGVVVPTIDPELLPLADAVKVFRDIGIEVVVSDPSLIKLCRDKRKSQALFSAAGIRYPSIYQAPDIPVPCFVKPYDGSSSKGARILRSTDDLTANLSADPRMIFMELIPPSFCEYTVDTYFDRNGKLVCVVPRKRLEVRSGEVSKGITKKDFVAEACWNGFANLPGARGCITIQVFANEQTQEVVGLEINPRFGGGFPLAYAAGAQFPRWLISEYLLGKSLERYDNWTEQLLMLRYDAKVLVNDVDL